MVDRKLLVEDWQEIDSALTELDCHRQDGTLRMVDPDYIDLLRSEYGDIDYIMSGSEQTKSEG